MPSFSQPAAGADELLLGTQFQNTQPGATSSQVRSGREGEGDGRWEIWWWVLTGVLSFYEER